jgi:hypothetical protein
MLLPDGTCPRCDPPMRRTTAEKLRLAKAFDDPKLRQMAEAEVHAGIATGLDTPDDADAPPPGPLSARGTPTVTDLDDVHGRIDQVEQRIDNGFAELAKMLQDLKRLPPAATPAPAPLPEPEPPKAG